VLNEGYFFFIPFGPHEKALAALLSFEAMPLATVL